MITVISYHMNHMVDQIKRVGGARHTVKYFQPGNRLMKMIRVNVWVVYPVNQLKVSA